MKALTAVFWTSVAAVGLALVMTIVTAVREKQEQDSTPRTIPAPATASSGS